MIDDAFDDFAVFDPSRCTAIDHGVPCHEEAIDGGRCLAHVPKRRKAELVKAAMSWAREGLAARAKTPGVDPEALRLANEATLREARERELPRIDALFREARERQCYDESNRATPADGPTDQV